MKKKLIVIGGPTASGKTGLSIALAKKLDAKILSADSRQFYKEVSIGTAKPSLEEQENIPHYFIHSHSLENPLTSGQFEKEALSILDEIYKTDNVAILVGGSGMFIDALIYGIDDLPSDKEIKAKLNTELNEFGIEYLLKKLEEKDTEYFNEVNKGNPHRIIRALEIIEITRKKYSVLRSGSKKARAFETEIFVLNHPREKLYERINRRVDIMVQDGLLDEVKAVQHLSHLQSLNTVGYKEIFQYLNKEISLDEALELIKRNSRRYAKRQITWFKRYKNATWIDYTEISKMRDLILEKLR